MKFKRIMSLLLCFGLLTTTIISNPYTLFAAELSEEATIEENKPEEEMGNDSTGTNESENPIGAEDGETEVLMETEVEVNESLRSETELIEIDEANFPDTVFREYVKSRFDLNGNNKLEADELIRVESIDVNEQGVANLKGIEFFTNLRQLDCDGNNLVNLDVSANTALEDLRCSGNNLANLTFRLEFVWWRATI